jgi:mRNA interferase MazF
MNEGDLVLAPLPQANGAIKNRPALVLRKMPGFGDLLVCGVSSQIHQAVVGFDEIIESADPEFAASGLKTASVIRLSFLAVLPTSHFAGSIGTISSERLKRLRSRLSDYLQP